MGSTDHVKLAIRKLCRWVCGKWWSAKLTKLYHLREDLLKNLSYFLIVLQVLHTYKNIMTEAFELFERECTKNSG